MILWVYGQNSEQVKERIRVYKRHFTEKFDNQNLNCEHFEIWNSEDLLRSYAFFGVQPFLALKRMLILDGVLGMSLDDKIITDLKGGLSKVGEETILVMTGYISGAEFNRRKLSKELGDLVQAPHEIYDEKKDWSDFIDAELRKLGVSLSRAQKFMFSAVKGKFQAENMVLQLAGLAENGSVKNDDILLILPNVEDLELFPLIDKMMAGNFVQTVNVLTRARLAGSSDAQLFSMLAAQIAQVLAGKLALQDGKNKDYLVKIMGFHPFVASKIMANSMNVEALRNILGGLYDAEIQVKNGVIDYNIALDMAILTMNS
jgi:DNA polymerase III delta subunit